jgi:valyl-tRNA synthetase
MLIGEMAGPAGRLRRCGRRGRDRLAGRSGHEVRQLRAEMNVPPGAKPPLTVIGASAETKTRLTRHRDLLLTLARLDSAREADAPPTGAVPFVLGEATGALAIAEFIDLAAEKARLTKEIAGHVESEIEKVGKKLGNPDFLARAKEEVVEENRERLAEAEAAKAKLEAALSRLAAVGSHEGEDGP